MSIAIAFVSSRDTISRRYSPPCRISRRIGCRFLARTCEPKFFISYADAFSRRLRRNYIWMFLILLLAWVLKISTPGLQAENISRTLARSLQEILQTARLGPIPGGVVLVCVALFYTWLVWASRRTHQDSEEIGVGEVHV